MVVRRTARALLAAAALASLACAGDRTGSPGDDDLLARARLLARETLILDTHVDVPYRLQEKMADIATATEGGDFDYPRARAGGLDAPFMSIYVPASYQRDGGARQRADELIDMVEGFERDHPDKFRVARSAADVRRLFRAGIIALPMGMENGAPVQALDDLRHFHRRGIRYITLTHSENNQICDSSYATERRWNGLSEFGRLVVAEMNRLGVMIDVSHISDAAFDQVIELSQAPVIASHSSCRAMTPGWERNIDDRMIRVLAERGGVVGINFGSAFLLQEAQVQSTEFWSGLRTLMEEHGVGSDDPLIAEYRETFWQDREKIFADVADVVDHIEHVIAVAGVDHVGFGSDFDGVGDSLPTGLKSVADYPNLVRELLARGHSDEDVAKICGGNFLRVWEEVEAVARRLQVPAS